MLRGKALKNVGRRSSRFVWRNHEILRIEAFSDAVFAFAVTLTVVSLEVPLTFHELMESMRGMFGFAICFVFLVLIWYKQYLFFRYFGLRDRTTIILNSILIFVVLFYVYPLKFLFSLLTTGNVVNQDGTEVHRISFVYEVKQLMLVYSAGFAAVYLMLFFLFLHAWNKRTELSLNNVELFNLKTEMFMNIIVSGFGVVVMLTALLLSDEYAGNSWIWFLFIGPVVSVFYSRRFRMLKKKVSDEEMKEHLIAVEKSKKVKHYSAPV
ncbi:MAG TPA: TMEM175 family protein [Chitinophagales bacterium]|nr:TMEM175 family protein [Chitinophagales bacterium]